MADDTTQTLPATSEETATQTTGSAEVNPTDPATGTGTPKLYTQVDLDRIAQKVRAEEQTRQVRDADRIRQQAEQVRLAEQGEYKTLHEQAEARARDLESEVQSLRLDNLRASVAIKHKLPEDIGRLLQGDTKEAMDAHAVKLARHLAPPVAPDTEGGVREVSGSRSVAEKATAQSVATNSRYANF